MLGTTGDKGERGRLMWNIDAAQEMCISDCPGIKAVNLLSWLIEALSWLLPSDLAFCSTVWHSEYTVTLPMTITL